MRRAALLTVVFAVSPLAGLVAQDIPSACPRVDLVRIVPWQVDIIPRKAVRPTPNVGLLLAPGSRLNLTEPLARSVRDGARDWRAAGAEALAYLLRSLPRQPRRGQVISGIVMLLGSAMAVLESVGREISEGWIPQFNR